MSDNAGTTNGRVNPFAAIDVNVSNDTIGDLGSPLGSSTSCYFVRIGGSIPSHNPSLFGSGARNLSFFMQPIYEP